MSSWRGRGRGRPRYDEVDLRAKINRLRQEKEPTTNDPVSNFDDEEIEDDQESLSLSLSSIDSISKRNQSPTGDRISVSDRYRSRSPLNPQRKNPIKCRSPSPKRLQSSSSNRPRSPSSKRLRSPSPKRLRSKGPKPVRSPSLVKKDNSSPVRRQSKSSARSLDKTSKSPEPNPATSRKKSKKKRSSLDKNSSSDKSPSSHKKSKKNKKSKKRKRKRSKHEKDEDDLDGLSSLSSAPSFTKNSKTDSSGLKRSSSPPLRRHRRRSTSPRPRYKTDKPYVRRNSSPVPHSSKMRRHYPPSERLSWEDKVSEFMNKITEPVQTTTKKEQSPEQKQKPFTAVEEASCDSISLTPLMRFVANKLSTAAKRGQLVLSGVFQYSILSLLNRQEWVAAKAIQLLDEAGHDNDWLYDNAAIKGGQGLKSALIESLTKGQVSVGKDKAVVDQFRRIIDFIVQYFTHDGTNQDDDENETIEYVDQSDTEPAPKVGLGAILDRLAASTSQPPPPPPGLPPPEPAVSEEINHWSMLADNMQSSSLRSFENIESYLSQDLLRVTAQNKDDAVALLVIDGRPTKDAFEVARHMVMCWVNAGYSYDQLCNVVRLTQSEDILPPRDPNDTTRFFIVPKKGPKDKEFLAHKFILQFKTMNKSMNSRQIDYAVWKSLLYVMRGCDKIVNTATSTSGYKVLYNYLPPGLREMEAATKYKTNGTKLNAADGTSGFSNNQQNDLPPNIELSEDPMNIIIDPQGLRTAAKGETMPRRKYFFAAVHIEFMVFKGKQEVYEISLICQDMSSIEVFIVPEAMKNDTATLEALGFTLNRNLNKYFYVQSGTGCVLAHAYMNKALEKLVEFLEKKRQAGDENQNNGLVLLCKNQDCLGALLNLLSPDLSLNTIKGFGLLDSVCQLDEIQFNMVGNGVCFSTAVTTGTRTEEILAKTKPEILFKALESGLQTGNPGYEDFVQPHCFPVDGSKVKQLKSRTKNLENMYDLVMFVAVELKMNKVEVYLEGIYAIDHKDLRHKCDIVAHKFCQALVDLNLDLTNLHHKFSTSLFNINPDLILNRMEKPQRLKVINQTRACIDFVHHYFRKGHQ